VRAVVDFEASGLLGGRGRRRGAAFVRVGERRCISGFCAGRRIAEAELVRWLVEEILLDGFEGLFGQDVYGVDDVVEEGLVLWCSV
jgi:hypothetical protein